MFWQVKKAAERALKRLFDIRHGEAKVTGLLADFVTSAACPSPDTVKLLRETFRKTLSVMPEASDDEDDVFGSKW